MGGAALKHLVLGLLALLLLAVLTPATPAAASPQPRGLPGDHVVATTRPAGAPRLGTGRYVVHLPHTGATTYVRLKRSVAQTTLHLGAAMIGRGGSVGEGFSLELGAKAGSSDCGTAVAFRPTVHESSPFLAAATSTWSSDDTNPCTTAKSLYVTINPPSDVVDQGAPVQLRVYEEPPMDSSGMSLLTTPSPPVWSEISPESPKAVTPAAGVDDAPVVEDGTYALHLTPGQDVFVATPVTWGESLHAQLDAELPAGLDPADPGLSVQILGPVLDQADTGPLGTDPELGATPDPRSFRTGVMSQPVSYINRDSVDATVNGADLAGMHYVGIRYAVAASAGPLDVRLTLQTRPGDGAAPLYGSAPANVHPPEADSRLVDGSLGHVPADEGGQPARQSAEAGGADVPWPAIGLGVGALAVLVVIGAVVRRAFVVRRRRLQRYHGRHRS